MEFQGTSAISSIKKLYRIFTPKQKTHFAWLVFFTFLSSVSDLLGLASVIPVVGLVLSESYYNSITTAIPSLAQFSKNELLLYIVSLFLILIVLKNIFGLYINKLQVNFARNLYITSSMNMLEKVYGRTLLDIQKETSNELIGKLTYSQIVLCSNAAISTLIIINEAIVFLLTGIIVCVTNWQLFFLLIGILVPVMGYFYYRVKDLIKNAGEEKSRNYVKLYASAQEMIFGYTDIKIAGTENSFKRRFEKFARSYSVEQGKIDFMAFIPTRLIEITIFLCIILILLYGVFVIKDTEKIITTISLFSVIAYRSIPSVNRFIMSINNLNSSDFVFKDPDFLQDLKQDHVARTDSGLLEFKSNIRFNNVAYKYPGEQKHVIKNCELDIRKGEKIGIVGKSGSGKSTLVGNLLGFLHPTSGNITIDNKTLSVENVVEWWKIIGYVRQEVFIMNTTMAENIAIGLSRDEIDMARLNRAIKLSSLSELVAEWPEGVDTMLNERGNNLSGGQKQRIAIARAIYKGAEVLVFDEATAALDSHTEEEITNAIRELGHEDLTIIIIAHRYTSLKYCDKIYQLEQGEIANSYTYSELIEKESRQ